MAERMDNFDGLTRREFLRRCGAGTAGAAMCGVGWLSATSVKSRRTVWQIDPDRCVQCGKCATHCVLTPSAVKCFHNESMCGFCKLCFGYFQPEALSLDSSAENQLCPVGAIRRSFVENPYFRYEIDRDLCFGCGKCVAGCTTFGNGSLFLQVHQDLCLHCNECSIAAACPVDAFERVSPPDSYMTQGEGSDADA